jgi:hypothetical protein
MRVLLFALLVPLGLAACGHDERPVIVNPPAGSTVVVPPSGQPKICPTGTAC